MLVSKHMHWYTQADQYLCGFIYTPIHTHILPEQSLSSSAHRSALPKHMFTELNKMHVCSCLQITYLYRFIMPEMIFHARMPRAHPSRPRCVIFINLKSPATFWNEHTEMTFLKEKCTSTVEYKEEIYKLKKKNHNGVQDIKYERLWFPLV